MGFIKTIPSIYTVYFDHIQPLHTLTFYSTFPTSGHLLPFPPFSHPPFCYHAVCMCVWLNIKSRIHKSEKIHGTCVSEFGLFNLP